MPVDRPVPLATVQSMEKSSLRDLIQGLEEEEKRDLMISATRACESLIGRRLAPFAGLVETHRAEGVDVDELGQWGIAGGDRGDVATVNAMSYGAAISGGSDMVRRCWVKQRPKLYTELWAYSDVRISLLHSAGPATTVPAGQLIGDGIDVDTGLLWFRLGTYLPRGSRVQVTYSGGFRTVPADLAKACRYMAAADLVDEDEYPASAPKTNARSSGSGSGSSDGGYLARAAKLLEPYR